MHLLKLGRKVLTIGTVFSTILWSIGVAALVPSMVLADTCPTLQSGALIKVSGRPAIYAVDSNGKVLYFPSGDEFKSWNSNNSYGGYSTITQSCYDALPVPTMAPLGVNFRPGSYVVKRPSSDQLYVVEPGNMLATITPAAAAALYGSNYKVMTVADVFFPNYGNTRGAAITDGTKAHPGMLISNAGKTYLVNADGSISEVTSAGFTANRFKSAFVHAVSSIAAYTVGSQVTDVVAATADRTQTGGVVSTVPGGTTTGGSASVALASDNPAATILASGTAFNPVLKVTLTAGSSAVSVTGLTVRKSGFAANTGITGIDVVDAQGIRHGNVASSISTDNDAVLLFSGSPVVVNANSSQTLTVRINLDGSAQSGTLQFSLVGSASVVTSGGSISGNFPITGNVFTLQNGSTAIASTTLDVISINPTGSQLNVDAQNEQDITKFQINERGNNENVKLAKLTLYNNGTAADTDVQDVQLVAQDGTVLATAQQSAKNVVFDLSASPYNIDKGTSKNFTVRAKIVNGAGRTVEFVVYNNYDAVLTGATTGVNVLPTTATGGTSNPPTGTNFPVGNAQVTVNNNVITAGFNAILIGSGTLSFNKDTTSPSTALTPGTNSVVLAKYFAKPTGENMELRKINLALTLSGGASVATDILTGSVTVRVNGASVFSGSPSSISLVSSAPTAVTLSTFPALTAGQNNTITVESNIPSGALNGRTIVVSLGINEVHRVVTNDIVTTNLGNLIAANSISVQAGALKVTNLATPVASSVVPGSSDVTCATIELNAGAVSSGEDVKVSKLVVTDNLTGGATSTDFGNLVMVDSSGNQLSTSASTATDNGTIAFNFTNPLLVSKTGASVLTLKCDVLTGTAGGHRFTVASSTAVATGATTGNNIVLTLGTGNGQVLSVAGVGTLLASAVTGAGASPSIDQNVAVGTTQVPVFAFKLTAQNEPVKVTSLKLTASGTIQTANDLVNLKLFSSTDNGATKTQFASAGQMNTNGGTASTSFTWTATDNLLPAAVQPGTPVTVYVTADIGTGGSAVLGDSFVFKIAAAGDVVGKGASSGNAASNTTVVAVSSVSTIAPFSVVAASDSPLGSLTQSIGAGTQIAKIKITNNGSAKVTIKSVKFTNTGSSAANADTYNLLMSDQGSTVAATAATGTVANAAGIISFPGTSITLDGGSSRYLAVSIGALNSSSTATWQLSVASLPDITYQVVGTDVGYAVNADGVLTTTSGSLFVEGKPVLGTLTKS